MEHKPIRGVKMLDDDKSKFHLWHNKFVNAMSQVNGTYVKMLLMLATGIN